MISYLIPELAGIPTEQLLGSCHASTAKQILCGYVLLQFLHFPCVQLRVHIPMEIRRLLPSPLTPLLPLVARHVFLKNLSSFDCQSSRFRAVARAFGRVLADAVIIWVGANATFRLGLFGL